MNRADVITLAESIGLLYPDQSSFDYNHPQHMRLISKLEKFAQECYDKGFASGWDEAKDIYEEKSNFL